MYIRGGGGSTIYLLMVDGHNLLCIMFVNTPGTEEDWDTFHVGSGNYRDRKELRGAHPLCNYLEPCGLI